MTDLTPEKRAEGTHTLTTDLLALLDTMQARCDAASAGPWSATHGLSELPRIWSDAPQYEDAEFIAKCAMKEDVPDAEFIAAARSDVPRLIAAVRAVLELHYRRPHGRTRDGGYTFDFVAHGQTEFPDLCDHCLRAYPCETVTAITYAALNLIEDGLKSALTTLAGTRRTLPTPPLRSHPPRHDNPERQL